MVKYISIERQSSLFRLTWNGLRVFAFIAATLAVLRLALGGIGCALQNCTLEQYILDSSMLPVLSASVVLLTSLWAIGSLKPLPYILFFLAAAVAALVDPLIWLPAVWGVGFVYDIVVNARSGSRSIQSIDGSHLTFVLQNLSRLPLLVLFGVAIASFIRIYWQPNSVFRLRRHSASTTAIVGSRLRHAVAPKRVLLSLSIATILALAIVGISYALAFGFLLLEETYPFLDESGEKAFVVAAALVALLFLPLSLLIRFLLRFLLPDAESLLRIDQRAPTLLLRSFSDDTASITPTNLVWQAQGRKLRLEEAISPYLNAAGPLVAIGIPGDRLPPLGAARSYFSDDEWQTAVLAWMSNSSTVAFVAGNTPWVRWEFDQLKANAAIEKAVVLFPPTSATDRRQRWTSFQGALNGTPYEADSVAVEVGSALALFFCDGKITAVQGQGKCERDYALALHVALCMKDVTDLNAASRAA